MTNIILELKDLLIKEGYISKDLSVEALSGKYIYTYYFERAEKYKLGLNPQNDPNLDSFAPIIIYDGMAYEEYLSWPIPDFIEEKNYYFFRRRCAKTLDISSCIAIEGKLSVGYNEFCIFKMFKLINEFLNNKIPYGSISETEPNLVYSYLYWLHIIGRLIVKSWKEEKSIRLSECDQILDRQFLRLKMSLY